MRKHGDKGYVNLPEDYEKSITKVYLDNINNKERQLKKLEKIPGDGEVESDNELDDIIMSYIKKNKEKIKNLLM